MECTDKFEVLQRPRVEFDANDEGLVQEEASR
jgi:hypothetical protein